MHGKSLIPAFFMLMSGFVFAGEVDPKFYNKNESKDDVLISLPCDIKMAFKKIYTSHDKGRLKDAKYNAGMNSEDDPLSQSLHERYVQGSFYDKDGYYFLMGKYEVSELQYAALTKDKCPKPSMGLTRPAVNISWFDALDYANKLSIFIQKNKEKITTDNKDVFVRLPTESEWEFAARGGLNVSSAEFNAVSPILNGGDISEYAQVNSPQSANGKIKPVGLLKPNALDLYDTLGNVNEYMFNQFSITRTGRLHGQSGGIVVRGGSFLTAPAQISYALRFEKPYYFNNAEYKARDVGMRLVIGQSVFSQGTDVKKLKGELSQLGYDNDSEDTKGGNAKLVEQLDKQLSKIEDLNAKYASENKELTTKNAEMASKNAEIVKQNAEIVKSLNELKTKMLEANIARDNMRDQSIISALRLGASLCGSIATTKQSMDQKKAAYEVTKSNCEKGIITNEKLCAEDRIETLKRVADSYELEYKYYIGFYADHVVDTYNLYDLKKIEAQLNATILKNSNIQKRPGIKSNFNEHVGYFIDMLKLFNKKKAVDLVEKEIGKKCLPVKM